MRRLFSNAIQNKRTALAITGACGLFASTLLVAQSVKRDADADATKSKSAPRNLLLNGGFEEHHGVGTLPDHWQAIDEFIVTENVGFFGWVAPRVERKITTVGPRNGRYFVGLDTEMLGVDTAGPMPDQARSALYQTVTVPGKCRGTFSFYYNDIHSGALSHITAIRLAFTINHTEMSRVQPHNVPKNTRPPPWESKPDIWSEPFFRVSKHLEFAENPSGGWTLGSIEVNVDEGDAPVQLTLWIGIFDNQSSTEIGYYRIDDASFVLHE